MAGSLLRFAAVFGFVVAKAKPTLDLSGIRERAKDFLEGAGSSGGSGGSVRDAITQCTQSPRECREKAMQQFTGTADLEGLSERAKQMSFLEVEDQLALDTARQQFGPCMQRSSRTEVATCSGDAARSLMENLKKYVDPNKPADVRERIVKAMEIDAKMNLLQDSFLTCLQTKNARTCKQEAEVKIAGLGLRSMGLAELKGRAYQGLFNGGMRDCNETAPVCRASARAAAAARGMLQREFAVVKEMSEKRGGAEVWARCKDVGESDADCMELMKEEMEKLGGIGRDALSAEALEKAKKLGQAMRDGVRIITVKRQKMLANVLTNGASCVAALQAWFAAETGRRAKNSTDAATGAVARACRLLSGKAEYRCSVDVDASDEDIATVSDEVATSYEGETLTDEGGRLLSEGVEDRRLASATVEESYAAQDVEECAETDTACTGAPATNEVAAAPRAVAMGTTAVAALLVAATAF